MKTAEEWCSEGVSRAQRGDLPGALAAHEAALAIDPGHFGALSRKPLVEHSLGLHEAAIASYRLYLESDPLNAAYVVDLANLLVQEGDEPGAWNLMIACYNAGSDDPALAINAAYVAESFGRADIAATLTSGIYKRRPNDPDVLAACANVAGLVGDHGSAIGFAKAAAAIKPSCWFTSKWFHLPTVA